MDESQLICSAALAAMRAQLVALESAVTENEGKTSGLQLKIKHNSDNCVKRGGEMQSLEAQIRRGSEELEQLTNRLNGVRLEAQNMDREVETSSARKSECIRQLDEQTRHLQELEGKAARSNESLAARKSKHASLVETCSHMKDKFAAVGTNAAKILERLVSLRARHAELEQLVRQGLADLAKATASFGENVGEWIDKISNAEKAVLDIQAQQVEVDQRFEEARAMAAKFADECQALDAQKQALAVEVAQRRANVAASDETKSKLTADLSSTRASIAALEQSRQAHTVLQSDQDALDAYGQELATRRNQHAIALQSLQTREDSQRKRALGEQMKEWDAKFNRIRHENETALAELDRAILQQAAPMS
jgi:chromosome segregation ATPase